MELVNAAVFDVDGVMSTGQVLYMDDGTRARFFNVRDGLGLSMLKALGVSVWMTSQEDDKHLFHRAEKLGVNYSFGLPDKLKVLEDDLFPQVPFDQVAFMGDDLGDLSMMNKCGVIGCPADAAETIKRAVIDKEGFVSTKNGGDGAVREFCEWLVKTHVAMLPVKAEKDVTRII